MLHLRPLVLAVLSLVVENGEQPDLPLKAVFCGSMVNVFSKKHGANSPLSNTLSLSFFGSQTVDDDAMAA